MTTPISPAAATSTGGNVLSALGPSSVDKPTPEQPDERVQIPLLSMELPVRGVLLV